MAKAFILTTPMQVGAVDVVKVSRYSEIYFMIFEKIVIFQIRLINFNDL